jgi:hypothetical protein
VYVQKGEKILILLSSLPFFSPSLPSLAFFLPSYLYVLPGAEASWKLGGQRRYLCNIYKSASQGTEKMDQSEEKI